MSTTSTSLNSDKQNQNQDSCPYPYNGKVLLAAVIFLSVVISFVIFLHIYARWFLRRRPQQRTTDVFSEPVRPRRSFSAFSWHAAWEACFHGDGLDAKSIASIPVFVYKASDEKQESLVDCVVCLSVMEDGEKGRVLPQCKHVFHVACIDAWLVTHSTCPICRAEVVVSNARPSSAAAVDNQNSSVVISVEQDDQQVNTEERTLQQDNSVEATLTVDPVPNGHTVKEDVNTSSSSPSPLPPSSNSSTSVIVCSSSTSTTAPLGCSLKNILSKSRSESRIFPS